jgi:transcriptional regulatory protein LevR
MHCQKEKKFAKDFERLKWTQNNYQNWKRKYELHNSESDLFYIKTMIHDCV